MAVEPAVYHMSKVKILRGMMLAIILIAVAAICIHIGDAQGVIFGWIGVVVVGAMLVAGLFNFFKSGPMLVISESGIFDVRSGFGLIEWDDIVALGIASVNNQRFIVLQLRDTEKY